MVAFTIVLAIAIYTQISVFLELVSAATCSPLAFTLPALFHYKLVKKSPWTLAIVICTTVLTGIMVIQSCYAMVKGFIDGPDYPEDPAN